MKSQLIDPAVPIWSTQPAHATGNAQ